MNPAPPYVLVVDDEPAIARLVADYLRAAGFEAATVHHGDEVLPHVAARAPDLLVLDLMLPGQDGLALCRALRAQGNAVPVLMLTAKVEEIDRLLGLQSGADDYVCKPFSPREVVARVQAILRRAAPRTSAPDDTPDGAPPAAQPLLIDDDALRATLHGHDLNLTPTEWRLLKTLASASARVWSRDQLIDHLHDDLRALNDRTIDSHVKNLRRKFEQAAPGEEWIRSVYGVGYRFEQP